MAKKKSSKNKSSSDDGNTGIPIWSASGTQLDRFESSDDSTDSGLPTTTGRILASMPGVRPDVLNSVLSEVQDKCGLKEVCHSSEFAGEMDLDQSDQAEITLFDDLGVAVMSAAPDQEETLLATSRELGLQLEQERWNYTQSGFEDARSPMAPSPVDAEPGINSLDYLKGLRDGLSRAILHMDGQEAEQILDDGMKAVADFFDSAEATWGLQATGALGTMLTGAGTKIGVLDSGADLSHPDFIGRAITTQSFIPSQVRDQFGRIITLTDVAGDSDVSGHGTHCIGTAAGAKNPQGGRRYGVAPGAEVFSAKVLSVIPGQTRAAGADKWIFAGMDAAIKFGCNVLSMSLGSKVARGARHSPSYQSIASDALRRGILIFAAAGNDSRRNRFPPFIAPVASPANCPSILAVGALDHRTFSSGVHRLGFFSNRFLNRGGGEVNFSAPGVDVLSSHVSPRIRALSGTSQATPHVAGIAALIREEQNLSGFSLFDELKNRAIQQGHFDDYGRGLVHF